MIALITMIASALGAAPTPLATPLAVLGADTVSEFGQSSVDFTWLFIKMVFAMVFVIALAILVIRFIIPKLALVRSRGRKSDLEVLDRIPLDAKKALYIIRIEGRRLLISVSDNHMGLIAELDAKDE
jgi:flagellar biogenesis protein FliO